jgi:chemotaxis protein methyltransferase CheR
LKTKGFDGRHYKPNYIKRRIAVRMRALEAKDYRDYLKVLRTDPREPSLLFDRLTIHVTEFFRDPEVYRALKGAVLPELPEPADGYRIWCAGCSTGEEPYSVAMMMEDWATRPTGVPYEVLATDIDAPSVRTAERGEYPTTALGNLTQAQIVRFFKRDGDRVRVLPDLKRKVRFRVHDLLSDWEPGSPSYHLVLCRNMLIYLAGPQQQGIYAKFAQALLPGGFLVLGLTETLLGTARRYFRCVDVRHRIYRRVEQDHS